MQINNRYTHTIIIIIIIVGNNNNCYMAISTFDTLANSTISATELLYLVNVTKLLRTRQYKHWICGYILQTHWSVGGFFCCATTQTINRESCWIKINLFMRIFFAISLPLFDNFVGPFEGTLMKKVSQMHDGNVSFQRPTKSMTINNLHAMIFLWRIYTFPPFRFSMGFVCFINHFIVYYVWETRNL